MTTKFTAEVYYCEPCSIERDTLVTDLVRHMKNPAVVQGKLTADEYWTCPFCLEPKFPASRGAKMPWKPKPKPVKDERPPRTRPRLVVSNPDPGCSKGVLDKSSKIC
jgi:hypothetical protein